jgi:hypothetical protein
VIQRGQPHRAGRAHPSRTPTCKRGSLRCYPALRWAGSSAPTSPTGASPAASARAQRVTHERDILEKATAFFAKESSDRAVRAHRRGTTGSRAFARLTLARSTRLVSSTWGGTSVAIGAVDAPPRSPPAPCISRSHRTARALRRRAVPISASSTVGSVSTSPARSPIWSRATASTTWACARSRPSPTRPRHR